MARFRIGCSGGPGRPRGRGRHRYCMSGLAWDQRQRSLAIAHSRVKRLRRHDETLTIKLLIWQWYFDSGPKPSLRTLARQLGVSCCYVHKVKERAAGVGRDILAAQGRRITLDDLVEARRFTARIRQKEPGLLAPPPSRPYPIQG